MNKRFLSKKEISRIIWGIDVNSFNRFDTFIELLPNLKGRNYWFALRNSYEDSDNLFYHRDTVRDAFLRNEPGRDYLMNKAERDFLKSLPMQITIYRGMTLDELRSQKFGISWTLNESTAIYFATQYQRNYTTAHLQKVVHKQPFQ